MINYIAKILNNRYKKKLSKLDNPHKERTYYGNIPKPPVARTRKRSFKNFEDFSNTARLLE